MIEILLESIDNEIQSLTNEDPDLSKRMYINNPIMTRALETLSNNSRREV